MENIIELIEDVVGGGKTQVDLPFVPIQQIDDTMKSLGFEKGKFYSNGWQLDFWLTYKKVDKRYTYSGSLYYGQCKFYHDTDNEDEYPS